MLETRRAIAEGPSPRFDSAQGPEQVAGEVGPYRGVTTFQNPHQTRQVIGAQCAGMEPRDTGPIAGV
jgi:hypothetical protein